MNPNALLESLTTRGIRLTPNSDRLSVQHLPGIAHPAHGEIGLRARSSMAGSTEAAGAPEPACQKSSQEQTKSERFGERGKEVVGIDPTAVVGAVPARMVTTLR
jgi:hypothetical protein